MSLGIIAEYHPDLAGKDVKSIITGSFEVVQNLFSIDIVFNGDDRYSNSQTVFVKPIKDIKTGRIFLHYIYDNHTPESLPTDEQYHAGAARLEIDRASGFEKMNGVYWTNRNWSKGLGRVDKRDSHDGTDVIQDSFQMGGYLGAESYVERGMGVL